MRHTNPGRRGRIAALAASAVVVAPLGLVATSAQADEVTELQLGETKTYIVQLADDPIVAFDGGKGLQATAPKVGEKVDADSAAAQAYTDYLAEQRSEVLSAVGLRSADVVTTYEVAFNGFAVKMNGVEAAHMRKAAGVVNVWEDEIRHADTVQTPDYLGLTGEGGVWETQFGGVENAGEGVVVGVIDTGIDPLNPSFADDGISAPPADWAGECAGGTDWFAEFECNDKIVGARWYGEEYGNTVTFDFESARDMNGHGSHTAGTAAGNDGVDLTILGADMGEASGMAPQAHVAAYKALWQTSDGRGSGTTAGLVAAIDDATADGVDVINYSVSGSSTSIAGPDEIAFLFAADAGIFVSTSAGNSGDTVGESSVAHNAPWTMTVAASTHNRGALNSLTLGNDETYDGVGYGGPLESTPMELGENLAADGVDTAEADLCAPGSLDDTETAGMLVVCTRGAYALVDKAQEVMDSGGAGMVLVNDPAGAGGQNAIIYGLPATHLLADDGVAVKAYVEGTENPTGSISATTATEVNAPQMASFSSYGPALAGGGDLLKPDITAPGVDVAAAYHPNPDDPSQPGFDQISGTSMSAPHIAGLAALMKQEFPEWSPAAIKSAMMTTARDTDDDGGPIQRGGSDASPLDFGAGEVVPIESYNPGLVYDAGWDDWLTYMCAVEPAAVSGCDDVPAASDLNYPSIAVGALAGTQTVTRTVTDVTGVGGTYTADVEAPAGTTVTVDPATIVVPANGSATFEVTITATTAEPGSYTFGQLRLVNGDIVVESPIAVQPSALAAPQELAGEGTEGSIDYQVTPGFTGTLTTDVDGLIPSDVTMAEPVSDGPSGGEFLDDAWIPFTVPAGTGTLRVSLFDEEISVPGTDMDLYLVNSSFQIVAQSAVGGSDESVTLHDPAAGSYFVAIDYWDGEAGESAVVPTHIWTVTDEDAGNMTVSPESVSTTMGEPVDMTVAWAGLESYSRYLGAVNYHEGEEHVGKTVVSVTTGDPVVERWGGENRYETAAMIAANFPEGVDTVYIATGDAYADALAGSAPAAKGMVPGAQARPAAATGAPILLVKQDRIPQATSAALESLDPTNIIVLGDENAVGAEVEDQLEGMGDVTRLAGEHRYETAILVAAMYGDTDKVYVASGEDGKFPDALAGSALAGHEGHPVILTKADHVPAVVADYLAAVDPAEVVVLGGEPSVSADVYTAVGATDRLAGPERWSTSVEVSKAFGITDLPVTFVTNGNKWPDALAGGALAGTLGVPIELTKQDAVPSVVQAELDRVNPDHVVILGDTATVSTDVEDWLNSQLPGWVE